MTGPSLLRRLRALHLGALAAAVLLTAAGLVPCLGHWPARPIGLDLSIAVIAVPCLLVGVAPYLRPLVLPGGDRLLSRRRLWAGYLVPWSLAVAVALLGAVIGLVGHRAMPVAACGLAALYHVGRFPPRRDEVDRAR
jgi:hypothetical protein